jgi:two-component system, cell cycle sensor histidine kinase and response regulator CckA
VDAITQALQASEERLRHIVEHAQDLIYYCDATGHFTFVNPAAARVMKYDEQELIGRHFLSLIRPDHRAEAGAFYAQQMVEAKPSTYFEFPAVARDGTQIWLGQHVQLVYERGAISAVHAIARDISRQKEAEERLKQSEERYRSLIQGAAYGIFRTTVDGTILEANPALAQMLGYGSVAEVLALNMSAIYQSREDRAALIDRYNRTRNQSLETDVVWRRKDGSEIAVHMSARIVSNDDGSVGFEGIAEDVTERRALEAQLRRAQKMEAVGRLARGVAHDFNNVLAAILGTADLLLLRLKSDPAGREDAEEIRKAAERGAALTKQLLAFSRSQTLEPKLLDLNIVVPQMQTMLERLAGKEYRIAMHTAGTPSTTRVEPGQLEQVLLNLVVNARDAMPKGGTIDVDVSVIEHDAAAAGRYPGVPAGPYVRLAVHDTGPGIDQDLQAHIFEPFFSTKGTAGTGLGLSIVYGIARDLGGTITFTTAKSNGTTFDVIFPLAPQPPTEPSALSP